MSHDKQKSILKSMENCNREQEQDLDHYKEGDYAEANKLPFQDLLKIHHKQIVWGFKFGEEVMASTLEKRKCIEDAIKSPETTIIEPQPCCSKSASEEEQKTPHSRKRPVANRTSKRKNSRMNDFDSPQKTRRAPLPLLNWADSNEVWLYMVYKEEASLNLRNPRLFEENSNFMPRMRAILLDWVMEVCEVYHLRRVTYYLTVDYFDRFLSIRPDVPKNQLQLVGVTCLFLAAKLEEIYPPRLTEFSYVCDGACSPEEILSCELLILNSLGWDLNIMTPSDWLNLYMQIHFQATNVQRQKLHLDINKQFIFPQYSGYQFTRASQLLDMCSLDPGFLKFSYSTIAAAAMYFMYGKKSALSASGLTWKQLQPCAEYMAVFYHVIRDTPDPRLLSCKSDGTYEEPPGLAGVRKRCTNLIKDENHSLQTHVVSMEYFERSAIIRLEQMGMKVERTYVEKTKKDKKNKEQNETQMVCMYDVEKLQCDAVALDDDGDGDGGGGGVCNDLTPSTDANVFMPDDYKALMSLDEILEGIIKCNQKNICDITTSPESDHDV